MTHPIAQSIEIHHGKPVVQGRRIPVEVVIGSLAAGMSYEEVMSEYFLNRAEIEACLKYVSDLLKDETHYPLPEAS